MSDHNTAVELFADDILKIVMKRLSVRLMVDGGSIAVLLVDNKTGTGVRCTGQALFISQESAPRPLQLSGELDLGQPEQLTL